MLTVTGDEPGETLIAVYIGGKLAKEFNQKDVDALPKHGPAAYSGYNTWPEYKSLSGMQGVRVMDLLSASGVMSLSSSQGIKFVSSDGYTGFVTVGQLEEPRYFFNSSGARGAQLPSIINFAKNGDYRRLVFGQAAAFEQIFPAFIKDVVRIDVEGPAGNWGSPGVSPSAETKVKKGDLIRLTMPQGQGDSKIYYTLDGSVPTRNSKIYNPVADRWLMQRGMTENTPISAPSDAFILRARVIGIGRNDGPVVTFNFVSSGGVNPGDPTGGVIDTTIDELIDGSIEVAPGNSFFVPAPYGSITWNEDEMDGYYDWELGGYVFTPRPGFEGKAEFFYVDEDGVEHILSVTVESGSNDDAVALPDSSVPLAGPAAGSGSDGGGTSGGLPQWALITLCAVASAIGSACVILAAGIFRRLQRRRSEA